MDNKLPSIKILGTKVTNASKREILEFIYYRLMNSKKKFYIVTPNPEILTIAASSKQYQEVLNDAEVSLPDGIGVLISSNILKKGLKERIAGVEMMQEVCKESVRKTVTVGFLGGRGGVAEKTAECLSKKYKGLRVSFASDEWDERKMQQPHVDVLFVAFGAPKQELWMRENLENLPVTCMMGVGGSFDFISGRVKRAPNWVQKIGFEWLFRLAIQPWRTKRQLRLIKFGYLVLKEKISS